MLNSDTICALSTAQGKGAIAVIRLSGADSIGIADKLIRLPDRNKSLASQSANTVHFGSFYSEDELIDEVVISLFIAPHSYTSENIVEISCHASAYIQQKILETLIKNGARLAKAGEFTQRAFLNGKMDLSQAEAVADLIASGNKASHRLAMMQMKGGFSAEIQKLRDELLHFISLIELELDFSEEDVEFADRKQLDDLLSRIDKTISSLISSFEYGNAIKNGVPVAIIGRTNSGKSTLLNRLVQDDKAIVSEIAGTTRDAIEDSIYLKGVQFRFIDTAGLRLTDDVIENAGIQRTHKKYAQASIVLLVVDATTDLLETDDSLGFLERDNAPDKQLVIVLNKSDLMSAADYKCIENKYIEKWKDRAHVLSISAKEGINIGILEELLASLALQNSSQESSIVVTNTRHYESLLRSSQALKRAREGLQTSLPTDLLAQDIREILNYLGEITGQITNDEILGNIFKNFCIGK